MNIMKNETLSYQIQMCDKTIIIQNIITNLKLHFGVDFLYLGLFIVESWNENYLVKLKYQQICHMSIFLYGFHHRKVNHIPIGKKRKIRPSQMHIFIFKKSYKKDSEPVVKLELLDVNSF